MQKISPCLWFDTEGEDAARFYVSVFPSSRIVDVARYGSAGPGPEGSVMAVDFELDGQRFTALNGGPQFTFSEAISFQIRCEDQEEVDRYWNALTDGGEEGPCGWLKDRFGPLVAGRADAAHGAPRGSRPRALAARDGRDARDAQDRHRRGGARRRRRLRRGPHQASPSRQSHVRPPSRSSGMASGRT
jgi:predicted 3-demethylubiquinone-9 3-methyltransferase (glyoxalase superfamily)